MRWSPVLLTLSMLTVSVVSSAQTVSKSQLKACDLLFVAPKEGNMITAVTTGFDDVKLDHVAIVTNMSDNKVDVVIIEAVPDIGVRRIDVDSFLLQHREDIIFVGRVAFPLDTLLTQQKLDHCVGMPYDSLYLESNDAIYCSELVLNSFMDTDGLPIFAPVPMNFHDANGLIPMYWQSLYMRHGMAVPEGANGSNPGELSHRDCVLILGVLKDG